MEGNIVFDIKGAAQYLRVSVSTVRRRMAEHSIPFYRVGIDPETGPPRFRKDALDQYIADQEARNYQRA